MHGMVILVASGRAPVRCRSASDRPTQAGRAAPRRGVMRHPRPRSLLLLVAGSLVALAAWAVAEAPLDSWLAGLDLPPALGVALRGAGYDELGALTDGAGTSVVTEQQLKDWNVLPWHRRKLLGALTTLAEGQATAAAAAAEAAATEATAAARAAKAGWAATAEAEAARLPAEPAQAAAAGADSPSDVKGGPVVDAAGSYTVRLAKPIAAAGDGPEQALGLLLEDVPWHSSPLITGVVVGSSAHAAGVLPGSTVLSVDGVTPAAHGDAAVTALLAAAVAQGVNAGVLLVLRPPGPLVQTASEGESPNAPPGRKNDVGKGSANGAGGRRGKRGGKGAVY